MLKTLKKKSKKLVIAKLKLKDFLIHQLWVYAIVFVSLFLCAWIFNKWIEATMLCVAHTLIRNAFEKQFHFNKTAYCLILTCAIIWFAIPITPSIAVSLLSSIPVAFLVCFFGYVAQDRIDLLKATRKSIFDFKSCTREEVVNVCHELGYNKDKEDLAVMFFADRLKNKQIWEILCETQKNMEWSSVNKAKYRIKQDFKKYIKDKGQQN